MKKLTERMVMAHCTLCGLRRRVTDKGLCSVNEGVFGWRHWNCAFPTVKPKLGVKR
jgi:hypothetical protein